MNASMPATPGPWHVGGTFMPGTPDETCSVWSEAPPGYQSGDQVAQYVRPADAHLITSVHDLFEIVRAVKIGLDSGAIKAADIEMLYPDGPKRVTLASLVDKAYAKATGERT